MISKTSSILRTLSCCCLSTRPVIIHGRIWVGLLYAEVLGGVDVGRHGPTSLALLAGSIYVQFIIFLPQKNGSHGEEGGTGTEDR